MSESVKDDNYARVFEFPREVRVYGNISHVYIEGKDRHSTLIIDQPKPEVPETPIKEKNSKVPSLIIPIKKDDSVLEFVKVPLQKLRKHPKGEKVGYKVCPKVDFENNDTSPENIPYYVTDPTNFPKNQPNRTNNEFNSIFFFHQSEPLRNDLFPNLPVADLFHFQKPYTKPLTSAETKDEVTQVTDSMEQLFNPLGAEKPETKEETVQVPDPEEEILKAPESREEILQLSSSPPSRVRSVNRSKESSVKNSRSYLHYLITPKKDTR